MSEENKNQEVKEKKGFKHWYGKNYKLLLILPAAILIFALIYLVSFQIRNGDIVYKDISLTGGTTITVFDGSVDVETLKIALKEEFPDIVIRGISDIRTGEQQAFFVETSASPKEIRSALEGVLGYTLDNENSSTEFSGASISQSFYQQLRIAIIIAFVFMALVVFIIFRTPIPSLAVIISALADIIMTILVIDLLGIPLSIGGIVALLMLIGYSVDTDILLTTRIIKRREGSLDERMFGAFKTGMTMTLTSIAALSVALIIIYSFSDVLRQMFTILLIGLGFDLFNTWITNASILRWYAEKRGLN